MPSLPYHYIRCLELEGRHPADAGCWGTTINRLQVGEGLPRPETPWAEIPIQEGVPFPHTTHPPPEAIFRVFYFRRLRKADECANYLVQTRNSVQAAFHLTKAWATAPNGVIPSPSNRDPVIPATHAARLFESDSIGRVFRFQLRWATWGDQGKGSMPYDYFERYVFECWGAYSQTKSPLNVALRSVKLTPLDQLGHVRWAAYDECGHRIYAFEFRNQDERLAWTFLIERDGAVEVEELYVRPEYRRQGHGKWLADRTAELARQKGLPLRLWVPFSDCKSENDANYPALVPIARHLGVQYQPCPVQWAAYLATNERSGSDHPIEPMNIPGRARTPLKDLLQIVASLGVAASLETPVETTMHAQPILAVSSAVVVGTPEWDRITNRRAVLIDRAYEPGAGLTQAEQEELNQLQEISRKAVHQHLSLPGLTQEELTVIRQVLDGNDEPETP